MDYSVRSKDTFIRYHGVVESKLPLNIKLVRNKCYSYGLIVSTRDEKVLVLERKVPYCVENFMKQLHARKILYFKQPIEPLFEKEYLNTLSPENKLEYDHYCGGLEFEDKIDFSRGQLRAEVLRKILHNKERGRDILFQYVLRRFKEETGYNPCLKDSGADQCPLVEIQFKSLDGNTYTQYYFLARGFPKRIQKWNFNKIDTWVDQRLVFEPRFLEKKEAIKLVTEVALSSRSKVGFGSVSLRLVILGPKLDRWL
ncbi:uncharacterized protein TNIN_208481 [Trichonephila inaurata madagascariensis]|uniref:Uncharacterized protein n=1 Tax=Trichonephila inaurata madagascariensis TaxID=2747483 RepID=A0A8X6Y3M4_9ARAC|nr:uncharacterized protein TNIN_208481 [Trichonephila inaurata madagascariensis]